MRVGVILLNWNSGEFTIPCIASLLAGEVVPWRILVWDNASADGSAERIQAQFPEVTMIRSPTNIGFTGGSNAGIGQLLREGAEAVWILNNDTIVDKGCLRELLAVLGRHPEAAVATGKILYKQAPDRLWYAGGELESCGFGGRHRGIGDIDRGQYECEAAVGFASGCCMLVPAPVFQVLGLFHGLYFAYHEDVEWCWRARERGALLWYAPRAVLWHDVSASMKKNTLKPGAGTISAQAHYLEARNRIFTMRLHARGGGRKVLGAGCFVLRSGWLLTGLALRGRGAKIRGLLRGIRDGLMTDLSDECNA